MPTDKKLEIADLILSVLKKKSSNIERQKSVIGYFSLAFFFEHPIELF